MSDQGQSDRPTIRGIWLEPPLAFARLGGSSTPLDAFQWGPNDLRPKGSGKTTILPAQSLRFSNDGGIEDWLPENIVFKDEEGFRPVAPFFELWGEWQDGEDWVKGPITRDLVDASDLEWTVHVANSKPYNLTQDPATQIVAKHIIAGDQIEPKELQARCPTEADEPLIPKDKTVPLGVVRLSKPNDRFPDYRIRFIPGKGHFFGPQNFLERSEFNIAGEHLFLNSKSTWCRWSKSFKDLRASPSDQFVKDADGVSLGLIDDTCDGIISCRIKSRSLESAAARIVVAPPDYAPDRRPITSIADGLKDRTDRHDVETTEFTDNWPAVVDEVMDIFERVFETVSLMNIDVIVDTFGRTNPAVAKSTGDTYDPVEFFKRLKAQSGNPLPLSEQGSNAHRRFVVYDKLVMFIRRNPDFVEKFIRDPATNRRVMTREMPTTMIGSDGHPLHLTRRQFGLIQRFVQEVTEGKENIQ